VSTHPTLILPPPRSNIVFAANHPTFNAKETALMVSLVQRRSGLHSARARELRGKNRPNKLAAIDARIATNRRELLNHRAAVQPAGWRKSPFQPI
jgi:hypothetical protein